MTEFLHNELLTAADGVCRSCVPELEAFAAEEVDCLAIFANAAPPQALAAESHTRLWELMARYRHSAAQQATNHTHPLP